MKIKKYIYWAMKKNDDDGISLYDKVNIDFEQGKIDFSGSGKSDYEGYVLGRLDCGFFKSFRYLIAVRLKEHVCCADFYNSFVDLPLRKYGFYLSRQNFDTLCQNLTQNCSILLQKTYFMQYEYPAIDNFVFHKEINYSVNDALVQWGERGKFEYFCEGEAHLYVFICCDKNGNLCLPVDISEQSVMPESKVDYQLCEASGEKLHCRFGKVSQHYPYFVLRADEQNKGWICGMVRHKETQKKLYLGTIEYSLATYKEREKYCMSDVATFAEDGYIDYAFLISQAEVKLLLKDEVNAENWADKTFWVNDKKIALYPSQRTNNEKLFYIVSIKNGQAETVKVQTSAIVQMFFIMDECGILIPVKDLDDYEIIASD